MNTDLFNAVKQIIAKEGEAVLFDHRRIANFLSDLARDVPKPQKTAFVNCLALGFASILKSSSQPDRVTIKQKLAQKLHEEEGLDIKICGEALDLLGALFFGEAELAAEKARAQSVVSSPVVRPQRVEPVQPPPPKPPVQQPYQSPTRPTPSSNPIAGSKDPPIVRFLMGIGFEDADYPGYGLPVVPSILLSLLVASGTAWFSSLIFPGSGLTMFIISMVISFMAFFLTHVKLRVILSIIAGLGFLFGIISAASAEKKAVPQTTTVITAKTLQSANFRSAPVINGTNIIKNIPQGTTVTITGNASDGWTPIKYDGDSGWISSDLLGPTTEQKVTVPSKTTKSNTTNSNTTKASPTPLEQAVAFFDSNQYSKAVPLFETLVNEGNARAQGYLGTCYFRGDGVTQNNAKAIDLWNKAAGQGDARGQYGLGYAYTYGVDGVVKQDYAKGVEWLTKAAKQGQDGAQFTLGRCYQNGWGVAQNYDIAEEWYNRAANQGNEQAKNALNDWSFKLRDTW